MLRHRANQQGNSLIQVMIAAGIMSIIALSVASMLADQNKEIKAISEKLLTKEIESQMKALFANTDYCNCVFRGKKFNTVVGSEGLVSSDQLTELKTGFTTLTTDTPPCSPQPTSFIPTVGSTVTGSQLTIAEVGLTHMQLVSPTNYKADIKVKFGNSIRALNSIETNISFTIDPTANTPTNRPFASCGSTASGLPLSTSLVWGKGIVIGQNLLGITLNCPAGKKIAGWIPKPANVYPGHGCYGGYAISYRQGCNVISDTSATCYNVYTPGQWDNWCWGTNWDEGGWLICR